MILVGDNIVMIATKPTHFAVPGVETVHGMEVISYSATNAHCSKSVTSVVIVHVEAVLIYISNNVQSVA